jgi:hypothetical protein
MIIPSVMELEVIRGTDDEPNPSTVSFAEFTADRTKWHTRSPESSSIDELRAFESVSDFILAWSKPICLVVSKPWKK